MSETKTKPAPAQWEKEQIEQFCPAVVCKLPTSVYAQMLVELPLCSCCRRPMMHDDGGLWPHWMRISGTVQRERAGWVQPSQVRDATGNPVCQECAAADKVRFRCELCQEELPASEVQETIGTGWPDYLCKQCYQTVPAAQWCEKVEELEDAHHYDGVP